MQFTISFSVSMEVCGVCFLVKLLLFCAAPEVVNFDPLSLATDMWSIGVIAFIL